MKKNRLSREQVYRLKWNKNIKEIQKLIDTNFSLSRHFYTPSVLEVEEPVEVGYLTSLDYRVDDCYIGEWYEEV